MGRCRCVRDIISIDHSDIARSPCSSAEGPTRHQHVLTLAPPKSVQLSTSTLLRLPTFSPAEGANSPLGLLQGHAIIWGLIILHQGFVDA